MINRYSKLIFYLFILMAVSLGIVFSYITVSAISANNDYDVSLNHFTFGVTVVDALSECVEGKTSPKEAYDLIKFIRNFKTFELTKNDALINNTYIEDCITNIRIELFFAGDILSNDEKTNLLLYREQLIKILGI